MLETWNLSIRERLQHWNSGSLTLACDLPIYSLSEWQTLPQWNPQLALALLHDIRLLVGPPPQPSRCPTISRMLSASKRALMQAGSGDRANLHHNGACFGSPVSEAHCRRLTSQPSHGVVLHVRHDNDCIGEPLAGLDAVIVPGVWFKNEPLTIQEGQIADMPVIWANQGGIAELVRDGIDGLHFKLSDAQDLGRVLLQRIEDPDKLHAIRSKPPLVPGIEAHSLLVRHLSLQTITAKPRLD